MVYGAYHTGAYTQVVAPISTSYGLTPRAYSTGPYHGPWACSMRPTAWVNSLGPMAIGLWAIAIGLWAIAMRAIAYDRYSRGRQGGPAVGGKAGCFRCSKVTRTMSRRVAMVASCRWEERNPILIYKYVSILHIYRHIWHLLLCCLGQNAPIFPHTMSCCVT